MHRRERGRHSSLQGRASFLHGRGHGQHHKGGGDAHQDEGRGQHAEERLRGGALCGPRRRCSVHPLQRPHRRLRYRSGDHRGLRCTRRPPEEGAQLRRHRPRRCPRQACLPDLQRRDRVRRPRPCRERRSRRSDSLRRTKPRPAFLRAREEGERGNQQTRPDRQRDKPLQRQALLQHLRRSDHRRA